MKPIIAVPAIILAIASQAHAQFTNPVPTKLTGYDDAQSNGAAPQELVRQIALGKFHAAFLSTVSTYADSGSEIGYALSSDGATWNGSNVIFPPPPVSGYPALEIWGENPVLAYNRVLGDTVVTRVAIAPFGGGEIPLPLLAGKDQPRNPRIAAASGVDLVVVAERTGTGTVHVALIDTLQNVLGWSPPIPGVRSGDQYLVVSNDSGRVALVWSSADTVGFIESTNYGQTLSPPTVVFGTQIINGDLVRPGRGLDAVYVGNALEIVWSAVGSTPRSARILAWNPVVGLETVADSSTIPAALADSVHPGDDYFVIDRPSVGRYQGSAAVGIAYVVFKKSDVDTAGWNYGDIFVAEGALTTRSFYSYDLTGTAKVDERYPKVSPQNPAIGGLFMVAFQSDTLAGPNRARGLESRVQQNVMLAGVIDLSVDETAMLPRDPTLYQNYPNPFNPRTTIRYAIARQSRVRLAVYDLLGREVALLVERDQSPGTREVYWDAAGVASGLYFYRVQTRDFIQTKKMMVVR